MQLHGKIFRAPDRKILEITVYINVTSIFKGATVVLNNEQVIIIEGIPAFKLEFPSDLQTIKVFSTTSIDEYKKRFYHLYEWKGYEKTAIEELFRKRIKDEFHLIEPMKDQADMTIEI